jgi:hypothetical protein
LPEVVALNEPMKLGTLQNFEVNQIVSSIADFAQQCRKSLISSGKSPSMQIDGRIPDNMFADAAEENGLRVVKATLEEISFDKTISPDFKLIIKHNSGFASLMNHLVRSFCCFAIIRNPLALLASWNTINIPVSKGFVPVIGMFDENFKNNILKIPEVIDRQIFILNYLFDKFDKAVVPKNIIRYEEIIESNGKCLSSIVQEANMLKVTLNSKNQNSIYTAAHVHFAGERLLKAEGVFWKYYSKGDVISLMDGY